MNTVSRHPTSYGAGPAGGRGPARAAVVLSLALGLLASCAGVPQKALDDAERARLGADFASKCAPDEYAAAQRMMDRARELVVKKRYQEAEEAARTAQELFEKATRLAEARREECLARLAAEAAPKDTGLKPPGFEAPPEGDYDLKMIFFSFNDAALGDDARGVLQRHAAWLKTHPEVRIQIAGHCDERGSTEYNLALGERRADAVKRYLESLGVAAARMSTISYGEEVPLAAGEGEGNYRRNRRAEFRRR